MSETVAQWSEMPYTSHKRRSHVIEHRVVIVHYEGVVADVRHEVRSSDDDSVPSEWSELEAYEIREHGIRHAENRAEVPRS